MYPIELYITGGEAFILGAGASSIETRHNSENILIAMVARTEKLVQSRFFFIFEDLNRNSDRKSEPTYLSGPVPLPVYL